MCGSVMASEETWIVLGRGHTHTSRRGWVFSFLSMLEEKRGLAEGSSCNEQDFSCTPLGVQPGKFTVVWYEGLEGEANQGLQACSYTAPLLGLERKPNRLLWLMEEDHGTWLFFILW